MRLTARAVIPLLAAVIGAAGTARLGFWQLDRAAQKNALQAGIEQRRALPPLQTEALARDPGQVGGQLHRSITLHGRWLDDRTIYLDNRQMDGRVGFFVVTPLQLDDGSAVVVERGWIARDFDVRTRLAPIAAEPGRVSVEGRIATGPARLFEFDSSASGPIRQNLDLDAFARETGLKLRPLSIVQTGPSPSALQRNWPLPAAGSQKNIGYAFQWFALCALIVFLYVWFQLIRPRRRNP